MWAVAVLAAPRLLPIRDALMCDIATTTAEEWQDLTRVLALNGIKTTQDLTGIGCAAISIGIESGGAASYVADLGLTVDIVGGVSGAPG